jgi:hypothetical protein
MGDAAIRRRIRQEIGRRIRQAILERGYRREDGEPDVRNFAFDFRFDKGHVYSWMAGKMTPFKQILELSRALDCSIEWLLSGTERPIPKGRPASGRQHKGLRSLLLGLAVGTAAVLSPSGAKAVQPLPVIDIVPLIGSRRPRLGMVTA